MDSVQMLERAFRWAAALIVLVGVIPLGVAWLMLLRRKRPGRTAFAYRATRVPFSDAELRFLDTLDAAVGQDHRVFAKMRVADLLSVGLVESRSAWVQAFNRISAKHVDYVVCRRDTLAVVAAVELDDRSHDSMTMQQRDAFLEGAFASAGVRLVRVPVRSRYDPAEVRASVLGEARVSVDRDAEPADRGADGSVSRRCHICGSPMELRRTARGAEGVQEYFVCTNTPGCHARVAVRGTAQPVD